MLAKQGTWKYIFLPWVTCIIAQSYLCLCHSVSLKKLEPTWGWWQRPRREEIGAEGLCSRGKVCLTRHGRQTQFEHWKAISWSMGLRRLHTSMLPVIISDWVGGNVCLSVNKYRLFFSSRPDLDGRQLQDKNKHCYSYSAPNLANKTSRCKIFIFRMTYLRQKGLFQWQPWYLKDFMPQCLLKKWSPLTLDVFVPCSSAFFFCLMTLYHSFEQNLARSVELFLNLVELTSTSGPMESVFKGDQNLEDGWANHLSAIFEQIIRVVTCLLSLFATCQCPVVSRNSWWCLEDVWPQIAGTKEK